MNSNNKKYYAKTLILYNSILIKYICNNLKLFKDNSKIHLQIANKKIIVIIFFNITTPHLKKERLDTIIKRIEINFLKINRNLKNKMKNS
jgi:hypothetical protein